MKEGNETFCKEERRPWGNRGGCLRRGLGRHGITMEVRETTLAVYRLAVCYYGYIWQPERAQRD